MADDIEIEDQHRLAEIAAALDWPTTAALMHDRDLWWKGHRHWDSVPEQSEPKGNIMGRPFVGH
jgi:hypothetical protein